MKREEMARVLFAAYQAELHRQEVQSVELDFDRLNEQGKLRWLAQADAAFTVCALAAEEGYAEGFFDSKNSNWTCSETFDRSDTSAKWAKEGGK